MQTARTSRPSFPGQLRLAGGGGGERARLRLEGVRNPIVTTVARRRDDGLVVVQELPFLRLWSEVHDEQQRRARISRVAVDVQQDVPRLVLELAYDDEVGPASVEVEVEAVAKERRARDATIGYEQARPRQSASTGSAERRDRSEQATLVFATEPAAWRDSRPSTPPYLARRGTDLELTLRALAARCRAALDALGQGLAQALSALRTDP